MQKSPKQSYDGLVSSIRDKYPIISQRDFGASCPAGWEPLLLEYLGIVSAHINKKFADFEKPQILDIKDKRGSLRVTLSAYDEALLSVLEKLETLSTKTCIICSNPGHSLRYFELPLCPSCRGEDLD